MEFEAMIKVAFADAGDTDQLRAALDEIRADAEARVAELLSRSEDYANTGGPFPDRLPIVAITGEVLMGPVRGRCPVGPMGRRRDRW
jgi:Virulence activator alpha C-term